MKPTDIPFGPFTVYDLNDYFWEKADELSKTMPIYKNSHREIEANQVGALGEIVAEEWMRFQRVPFVSAKNTKFDYLVGEGMTLEVKTKDRTVIPRADYGCSIPLYNFGHQRPDYYLFISLLRDRSNASSDINRFKKAYILGAANQQMFAEKGKVWKKDQVDSQNGTKFWTDCKNLHVSQLMSLHAVSNIWSRSLKMAS